MGLSINKKIAGIAVAGVVALSGAGAVAWAETGGPGGTTSPPSTTAPAAGAPAPASKHGAAKAGAKGADPLHDADHGSVDIKVDGNWVTVNFDRGQVTDVAADHITLARPDGKSVTLQLKPDTQYHGVTSSSDIQKDKAAVVLSNADGSARQVAVTDKAAKTGKGGHHGGAPAPSQPAPTTTVG